MHKLDAAYWTGRYNEKNTGWDASGITTPLKDYIDQLTDKSIKILIPGAGNAHEAGYLWRNGFKNTYVLDWSEIPLRNFKEKHPDFPNQQLLNNDFFKLSDTYDLIVEQTFFCSFDPELRKEYADKVVELLKENGKVVGLLWNSDFNGGPPFGGTEEEYQALFGPLLDIDILETCYNSIKPRAGKESFIKMVKRTSI